MLSTFADYVQSGVPEVLQLNGAELGYTQAGLEQQGYHQPILLVSTHSDDLSDVGEEDYLRMGLRLFKLVNHEGFCQDGLTVIVDAVVQQGFDRSDAGVDRTDRHGLAPSRSRCSHVRMVPIDINVGQTAYISVHAEIISKSRQVDASPLDSRG